MLVNLRGLVFYFTSSSPYDGWLRWAPRPRQGQRETNTWKQPQGGSTDFCDQLADIREAICLSIYLSVQVNHRLRSAKRSSRVAHDVHNGEIERENTCISSSA